MAKYLSNSSYRKLLFRNYHARTQTKTLLARHMVINYVLDHTLQRESAYTNTYCTTIAAEKVFREVIQLNTVENQVPSYTGVQAKQLTFQFNSSIRKKVRNTTRQDTQEHLKTHVGGLQVQERLLTLAAQEKEDLLWKSSMFQLNAGTLKFMMNACIDTLATPANLKRWKYSTSDKCKLCGNRATTSHILNCCKNMLDTGRYTWRHNNLANFIVTNMDSKFTVFSDLPGGGTIPPSLCVTNHKPDIVIIDKHTKSLHRYELTMPLMSNIEARHQEKSRKYSHFLTDITGYTTTVNCFEVSSTGFINSRNNKTLHTLHKFMRKSMKKSVFMNNMNFLAWYGSYQIWVSRENPAFTSPSYLIPHLGNLPPSCEEAGRAQTTNPGL